MTSPALTCTTDEDHALQALARAIADRGLLVPALVVLEVLRPLGFLVGQALLLVDPLLAPLTGAVAGRAGGTDQLLRLLEDPERLERFLTLLEGQRTT